MDESGRGLHRSSQDAGELRDEAPWAELTQGLGRGLSGVGQLRRGVWPLESAREGRVMLFPRWG